MNTTLNKIRAHSPCADGWTTLLSHLGKTQADDEPLSIATILESNGLEDALWCLRAVKGHDKEIRLYAVWCARQVQSLMTSKESIAALDVAERHANGLATDSELATARAAAQSAALCAARDAARFEAQGAARAATYAAARSAAREAARSAAWHADYDADYDAAWHAAWHAARSAALYAAREAAFDPEWDADYDATYDAAHNEARAAQEQELLRICNKVTEGSAA